MKEEISKLTVGERRNALVKLWDEECERNEIISQKRWEEKNAPWFVQYEETFRKKYENKSRKENPQKPTQLSSRSHPRHLVGKRTAQKTPS